MPAILPPPKTQFFDANGDPLSGGKLYTYQPGTVTAKTTWQDPQGQTPNANPIVLDSAGRAVVWGIGQYRIQLYDGSGNLVYDDLTALPVPWDAAFPRFAVDTGAVNALTVALAFAPATLADLVGVPLYVQVGNTNTGAATLNVSNLGAVAVEQAGAALAAGALAAGGMYAMVYTGSVFQIPGAPGSGLTQASFANQMTNASISPTFGKVVVAESSGVTGGGISFNESGFDTGIFSPSDGVFEIWANAILRFKIDSADGIFRFYNGTTEVATLDASGNLICLGNVTAYGTPA